MLRSPSGTAQHEHSRKGEIHRAARMGLKVNHALSVTERRRRVRGRLHQKPVKTSTRQVRFQLRSRPVLDLIGRNILLESRRTTLWLEEETMETRVWWGNELDANTANSIEESPSGVYEFESDQIRRK